eukprot:TRINITY_DN47416_c0_g1_i1.p1 TRINITY_DN47416_c0_g1~~TRINITY_DN47416_c0_g1_i1.p1  ORF type:complete len:520 (+),score=128.99 TRINITY_DN47416_c0_g1_i1:566-2125(+)
MNEADLDACEPVSEKGARDAASMRACLGDGVGGADGFDDFSREALRAAAKAQLDAAATSLDEDLALLTAPAPLPRRREVAVRYRVAHKRLLAAIVAWLAKDDKTISASTTDAAPQNEGGKGDAADGREGRLQRAVARFNAWFAAARPPVSLIEARLVPGLRLGAIATADIRREQLYLSVPEQVIMSEKSAKASPHLKRVFKDLKKRFPRGDAFHELLVHLMYERFVLKTKSFFWPYLATLPSKKEMPSPLYYSSKVMEGLRGSVMFSEVQDFKAEVERKYADVKREVFDRYSDDLLPSEFTFEKYQWAYAVLSSRSIWWDGERHLVPMLDIINCKQGPKGSRVHSTKLDATRRFADTYAAWEFRKDEQLFEEYGQPNHVYFKYHGFSLVDNSFDCVRVLLAVADGSSAASKLRDAGFGGNSVMACLKPGEAPSDRVMAWARIAHGKRSREQVEKLLRREAKKALTGYPTTLEQDVALLSSSELEGASAAVIRFRVEEKKILQRYAGLLSEGGKAHSAEL